MIVSNDMPTPARKVKKVVSCTTDGVFIIVLFPFPEKSDSDSEGQ